MALLRDERLSAVLRMLGKAELVADIGCDHGYLSAALIEERRAERVIASDISPDSVRKAKKLAEALGISERMRVMEADGLETVREEKLPFKLAICGMGGELIAKLLERDGPAAERAELIVMQPMRGEEELRRYLFRNGFGITDECVAYASGRFYQIIAARFGAENAIPEGFPKDQFRFGWVMAQKRDPNLMLLLGKYREVYSGELEKAKSKGRSPERLVSELKKTDELIAFMEDRNAVG